MAIRVRLHGRFADAAHTHQLDITAPLQTVGDLLNELVQRYGPRLHDLLFDPRTRQLNPTTILLVDGHSIRLLHGLHTPLLPHTTVTLDTIDVLETVGGGS